MNPSDFLLTTDANNQKKYVDTEVVITTSTSVVTDYPLGHSLNALPDVRVWVKPSLMGDWKMLTDLQLSDNTIGNFELVRGQVSATNDTVTVSLRPSTPARDVLTKIRLYYND